MDLKKSDRRGFLKGGAALAGLAAGGVRPASSQTQGTPAKKIEDLIAYGERSRFVTSKRESVSGRHSPDEFGLTFHVLTPLQDFYGIITPSSLFYTATHRGAFVPDIDPAEHRLMIHGMVDRPLVFTMDDLKRLPFVSRVHFVECLGNRASASHKTVMETHGLTSCAEWTGVPLSLLLKEAGVQSGGSWIVAEGAEEVKGASSIPLAKAMDDCVVVYGMNGEPLRPQQGFPLRLMVPGFEGIYQIKYLRRIKVVDRYYMTYDDYGHIVPDPKVAALTHQIGPKSVITFPSGGQQLQGPGFYEVSGLAWSGAGAIRGVEVSTDGGRSWKSADLRSPSYKMAHTRFGFHWKWDGKDCVLMSRCTDDLGTVQPTRADVRNTLTSRWKGSGFAAPTIPCSPGEWRAMGACTMGWRRLVFATAVFGICQSGWTQSPTYGLGRTPSAEEIRKWDIAISPTGKELPPGQGTATEGAQLFVEKGCGGCHGAAGSGGHAPVLIARKGPVPKSSVPCLSPCVNDSNAMAIHSPFATTMWDYINRGMPLGEEGSLAPNEVYALTAYLLFKNGVIQEDEVMNAQSLPKVKMPNHDGFALPPAWKKGEPRLQGYP